VAPQAHRSQHIGIGLTGHQAGPHPDTRRRGGHERICNSPQQRHNQPSPSLTLVLAPGRPPQDRPDAGTHTPTPLAPGSPAPATAVATA